jgi:hypothetical protein
LVGGISLLQPVSKWKRANQEERKTMTKNIARKGFALGAGLSLALTGLVAPAAYAVDPVQLKETVGTGYSVLNTGNFEVSALITNAAVSGGSETVKFRIVDADGLLANAGIDEGDGDSGTTPDGALDNSATGAGDTNEDVLANFTDGVAVVNTGGIAPGNAYELMLDPTTATDAFSVTVQAWVDFDSDGLIDSGENASPVRTVTFYPADEVTFTVSLATPTLGAANLNSTVTTSPALNVAALADDLDVGYATYVASTGIYTIVSSGGTVSTSGAFTNGVAVTADDDYKLAIGGGGLAAATYVAQAVLGSNEAGNAVFFTVGASDVTQISAASVVASSDVTGTAIRTNASASFEVTVKDASNDPVAGEAVVFSFTETHSDTDAVITVGGHSIKNGDTASAAKTVTATTDADGVATVSASFSGFAAGNDFMAVSAKVAALNATNDLDVDFVDTAYGAIYSHNTLGTSAALKVAAGSSYALTYSVEDNFGALLADANFRVVIEDGGSVLKTATLGSGIASFTVTDQTTLVETWTATVQKYNTSTANWGSDLSSGGVAITPVVGASNSAAAVSLAVTDTYGSGTELALNLSALTASDTRLGQTAPTLVAGANTAAGNVGTLSGTVTDASGVATYSSVTLSAPGVLFASGAVTSLGSITVQTSAAGAFGGVIAYSNTSGDVTVTVTAGSASKTLDLTFAAAGPLTGTALTVNVANAAPGMTMTISGALTDKYGNTVETNVSKLKVTYTGPGFVVNGTPTATEADGSYELKVLLGTNDTVSGSVVVSYAGLDNAFTTGTSSDDLTVSATLAPAVAASKVNAGSFKGYVALYAKGFEGQKMSAIVAGKWLVVASLATDFERVVRFTGAGYDIVTTIYIDGVMMNTFNITTK